MDSTIFYSEANDLLQFIFNTTETHIQLKQDRSCSFAGLQQIILTEYNGNGWTPDTDDGGQTTGTQFCGPATDKCAVLSMLAISFIQIVDWCHHDQCLICWHVFQLGERWPLHQITHPLVRSHSCCTGWAVTGIPTSCSQSQTPIKQELQVTNVQPNVRPTAKTVVTTSAITANSVRVRMGLHRRNAVDLNREVVGF